MFQLSNSVYLGFIHLPLQQMRSPNLLGCVCSTGEFSQPYSNMSTFPHAAQIHTCCRGALIPQQVSQSAATLKCGGSIFVPLGLGGICAGHAFLLFSRAARGERARQSPHFNPPSSSRSWKSCQHCVSTAKNKTKTFFIEGRNVL